MQDVKRRRRGPNPKRALTGETLETWQADMQLVQWAQADENFRLALTVAIHERRRASNQPPGTTENRILGRVEGYDECLKVLEGLATGKEKLPPVEKATFNSEEKQQFTDVI